MWCRGLGFRALGFNSRVSGFGFYRIPGFLSMCLKKGTFLSECLVLTRGPKKEKGAEGYDWGLRLLAHAEFRV